MMTPEDRELLRRQIVRCCAVAHGNGVTAAMLRDLCRTPAGRPKPEEVEDELDYLLGKGLVALVPKTISPEIRAWKITASGRDYAAQEGLE